MSFRDGVGMLICESATFTGKLPFYEGTNLVGRNPAKTNITIKDRSVSEVHAKIICNNRVIKIVDNKSKNGVYINDLDHQIQPDE